ncbi:MBOAT family O-acyltransferase [Flavihumibacter sp. CACIAM 22H1]|uniref:MBOAT family O-acyltransferase n=1 Tax=Flavihumibacter sp. CACIAM 22H1 TaxID=1812911 RepID=UPI0007A9124B|nr:MBOAT family O-acyltransferase [Flavihumibacter sp. CACIAM 22H1]KYP13258.1 MAG: alginate O-acetyltransferase [Flavihumibacter sp. CACIAM 22H1]
MLFNSIEFVIFFFLVTSLYFILPHKYRWFLLLAASCYFYMAFVPVYILILFFTIVIDYFAGIWIEEAQGKKKRRFLVLSLIANIGVLAVFKYYNFLNDNLTFLLHGAGWENPIPYLSILLPIGLSFHTFQAMSYTIEVYRGHQKAERHFGIYSLYVMFYPQLVAGPIERPQNLLFQFRTEHRFDYDRVVSGLRLMLWGFFKKLVIADRLAIYVNAAYGNPEEHTGLTLAVATMFFAFQIYCDFSGYSDIAIGAARVMGYDLMKNFNRPYLSASISEFWSRWHISLSTWFKDYLYISLGGNRVPIPRWYFNLFITFLISGLWHGANWTYIIWGALNGFYLVFALIRTRYIDRHLDNKVPLPAWIKKTGNILMTFVLICFSWIFFRAASVQDAFLIVKKIFTLKGPLFTDFTQMFYGLIGLGFLLGREIKHEYFKNTSPLLEHQNPVIRYATYMVLIALILLIGVFDGSQFIYFQF